MVWSLLLVACGAPDPADEAVERAGGVEAGTALSAGEDDEDAAAGVPVSRSACGVTPPEVRWDPQPVGAHAFDEGGEYLREDGLSGATVDIGPIFVELHARLVDVDGDLGRGFVRLWLDREADGVIDTSGFPTVVRPIPAAGGDCGLGAASVPVECTLVGSGGLEELGDCSMLPDADYDAALQVVDHSGRASAMVPTRFRAPGLHG